MAPNVYAAAGVSKRFRWLESRGEWVFEDGSEIPNAQLRVVRAWVADHLANRQAYVVSFLSLSPVATNRPSRPAASTTFSQGDERGGNSRGAATAATITPSLRGLTLEQTTDVRRESSYSTRRQEYATGSSSRGPERGDRGTGLRTSRTVPSADGPSQRSQEPSRTEPPATHEKLESSDEDSDEDNDDDDDDDDRNDDSDGDTARRPDIYRGRLGL